MPIITPKAVGELVERVRKAGGTLVTDMAPEAGLGEAADAGLLTYRTRRQIETLPAAKGFKPTPPRILAMDNVAEAIVAELERRGGTWGPGSPSQSERLALGELHARGRVEITTDTRRGTSVELVKERATA